MIKFGRLSNSSLSWLKRKLPPGLKKFAKIVLRPSHAVVLPYKPSYSEDGLATVHNCDFINDPLFRRAYAKGVETGSWVGIQWRAHVYSWLALQAFRLPGDFVECGVNRGGYARMVFEYLPFAASTKKFYLMDTFNGFDISLLSSDEVDANPHCLQLHRMFRRSAEDVREFSERDLGPGADPRHAGVRCPQPRLPSCPST